jgi:hypothetical protein
MDGIGSIVFGPQVSDAERRDDILRRMINGQTIVKGEWSQACGCVGPQSGQTKCPCALRAESSQGNAMVRDGVTIDGVEYELVRKQP